MADDAPKSKNFHKLFVETVGFRKPNNVNIESDVMNEQPIRFEPVKIFEVDNGNEMLKEDQVKAADAKNDLNNGVKVTNDGNTRNEPYNLGKVSPEKDFMLEHEANIEDVYKTVLTVTKNEISFTKGDSKLQKITVEETPGKDISGDIKITRTESSQIFDPFCRNNKNIVEEVPETTNEMRFGHSDYESDDYKKGTEIIKEIEKFNEGNKVETATQINEDVKLDSKIDENEVAYTKPVSKLPQRIVDKIPKSQKPVANKSNDDNSRRVEILKICDPSAIIHERTNIVSEVLEEQVMRKEPSQKHVIDVAPKSDKINSDENQEVKAKMEVLKIQDVKLSSNVSNIRSEVPSTQEIRDLPSECENHISSKANNTKNQDEEIKHENQMALDNLKDKESNMHDFKDKNTILSSKHDKILTKKANEAISILDEIATVDASADIEEIFKELYEEDSLTEDAQSFDDQLKESTANFDPVTKCGDGAYESENIYNNIDKPETVEMIHDATEHILEDFTTLNTIPIEEKDFNKLPSGQKLHDSVTCREAEPILKTPQEYIDITLPENVENDNNSTKNWHDSNKIETENARDDITSMENIHKNYMKGVKEADELSKNCDITKDYNEFNEKSKENERNMDVAADDGNTENRQVKEDDRKYIYTPVITVTKEEIALTSSTSKLQKITVTEKLENIKDQEAKGKTPKSEKVFESITVVEIPMLDLTKNTVVQSDSLPSPLRKPEEVPKEKKDMTKSEIPRLIGDDHRPKIVDEITKKSTKKEWKESRIPIKAPADVKPINTKKQAIHGDISNNMEELSPTDDVKSVESTKVFKGKVKRALSAIEKRQRNRSIKDPVILEKNDKEVDPVAEEKLHKTKKDIPKENDVNFNKNKDEQIKVTEFKSDAINESSKTNIRGNVKQMIKNIVKKDKIENKHQDKVTLKNKEDTDKKTIFDVKSEIRKPIKEKRSKHYELEQSIELKGKDHSQDFGALRKDDSENISDENLIPKVNIRSKVKEMLRKIENKIQGTQNDQPTVDEKPAISNANEVVDKNQPLNRETRDKDLKTDDKTIETDRPNDFELAPRSKVKHILRSIEQINTLDDGHEIASKGNLPKEVIEGKTFLRAKSVSDTVAMFEKNTIASTEINTQTETEKIKTERKKYMKPFISDEASLKVHEYTVQESGPEMAEELEKESKLEELKLARYKYGQLEVLPTITLSNGHKMPAIVLGTDLMDRHEVTAVVKAAIDLGYRSIDCAYSSGNEESVGQAIKEKIENGDVSRDQLFVTSKLWNTFHHPELVEQACRDSLRRLGLDYLDMYLMHTPMAFKEGPHPLPKIAKVLQYSQADYLHTWYAMEQLVRKRLVRYIGVANFNSEQVARIMSKAKLKPVVNQVECHPYLSQQRLSQFCESQGIAIAAYGTVGALAPDVTGRPGLLVLEDRTVVELARKYGKTPAQVLIRYQIERGHAAVVDSCTASGLWESLNAATFTVEPQDVDSLDRLNKNRRYITFEGYISTVMSKKNPRVIGPKFYEKLPEDIIKLQNEDMFRCRLKALLLNKVLYSVEELFN